MRTKWTVLGPAATVGVAALVSMGLGASTAEARGGAGFSEKDLRGTYTAYFQGELTQGPVTGHAVAIGLVSFDGRGGYEVSRTVHVSGPGGSVILPQTADCTYTVNPAGGVAAECTVHTPGQPDASESLSGTITSRKHLYFMSVTPGLAAVGEARKQSGGH